MKNYLSLFTRRTADATPQALPIPGTVPNAPVATDPLP